MCTELLSVVDEHDRVIDTLPRHAVHAANLRHRAVHILVFNQQGNLFLQKRSLNKDFNKGLWDTSAAGHVDADEEYFNAAIRELKEELGVNHQDTLKALFKLAPTQQLGMEFIQVYQCFDNGPFQLNTDEIDEGKWVSQEIISNRIRDNDITITETFKMIWRMYQASL